MHKGHPVWCLEGGKEHCAYTVCGEQNLRITVLDPTHMVCVMTVYRNNTCLEALINSLDVLLCPDSFSVPRPAQHQPLLELWGGGNPKL